MRYHITLVKMVIIKNLQTNAGEDVEKREPPCTVGGNFVIGYSHYGEQYGESLKNLGIKLAYDLEIPLLGIHPEKIIIEKDTCAPAFTAALFTTARAWKQPRCPSMDEQIKKLLYIYAVENYSTIKSNEFLSVLVRWMNLELII